MGLLAATATPQVMGTVGEAPTLVPSSIMATAVVMATPWGMAIAGFTQENELSHHD